MVFRNGEIYDGLWRESKKHGSGKYIFSEGRGKYDGDWVEDEMEGVGIMQYREGDVYEG